jgi:hypothetical protein
MKVYQLIEKLRDLDQDLEVYSEGDAEYTECCPVEVVRVACRYGEMPVGQYVSYENTSDFVRTSFPRPVKIVYLSES